MIEIDEMSKVSLAGRTFVSPPSRDPPAGLPGFLQALLYENIFCRASVADFRFPGENLPPPVDREFQQRLLAATAAKGAERFDDGWQTISAQPGGAVFAKKKGFSRAFAPADYAPAVYAPAADGSLRVRLGTPSLADQPGFFYLHGAPRDGEWDKGSILRLYFDLSPAEVPNFATRLAARLERFRIPFHFKILLQPAELARRCDGAVLFVQRRHFPVAGLLCLEHLAALPAGRRSPLFTRELVPGLGMAEDPGGSFGISRCQLLAEALWNCHRAGISGVEEQVAEARRVFAANGLDPERPYLNPGSAGYYPLACLAEGPL